MFRTAYWLALLVRGLLRIRMADVWMPRNTRIVEIAPNHYTVRLPDGQFRSDFRTHWKYSKRVYFACRELWWLMHAWDSAFADRWAPAYSWGLSTLTAYPDPDPETTTVDGRVIVSGVTDLWATLIAEAGSGATDTAAAQNVVAFNADSTPALWTFLARGIFLFDTGAIPDTDTISAAVLSLYGSSKSDSGGYAPTIDIYTSAPASNTALEAGDFDSLGSTSQTGSPIAYADVSTTAYNDFTFNATGIGNISKTGVSKFGIRNANYDVAASSPTWADSLTTAIAVILSETAGTTTDPKLVVTHAGAGGGGGSGVPPGRMRADIWRSKGRR